MIVKDEAEVITRAFNSVKHIVDYYCICDTGSTDNTIQVIKDYFKENNLKGEVHERPWVNFGHNRTECFQLASGISDYNMTLDADEVFCPFENGQIKVTSIVKKLPKFETDSIGVITKLGNIEYPRTQFMKDNLGWEWHFPCHEYVDSPNASSVSNLDGVAIYPSNDGARAKDNNTYAKDALVFEHFLLENPDNSRAWFYLAQSYRDSNQYQKSLDALEKVIELDPWDEQVFIALLRKARIYMAMPHSNIEEVAGYFLAAYQYRPQRAEPLHDLLRHYRLAGQNELAVLVGEAAVKIPLSSDILFIETELYNYKIKDELSVALFNVGRVRESLNYSRQLLRSNLTPEEEKDRLRSNIKLCLDSLKG